MDILQYAPHAGVVVAIVIIAQIVKATPLGVRLAEWYVFVPFGLGILLGIPVSFAIGQTAWFHLIINPFLEACIAAALFKVGKTVWQKNTG